MTHLSRMVSLSLCAAVLFLAQRAAAQNYVTPVVKSTPPGQLIVVNNGPADQIFPQVDGDLVCYTDELTPTAEFVRYHNLDTGTDNAVPPALDGSQDLQCDMRGTTIAFTRSGSDAQILTFDTVSGTLTNVAPQANAMRFFAQIGDQTIAWAEFSNATAASSIMAYDRTTGSTTTISGSLPINLNLGISRDGSVLVWEGCVALGNCVIWKSTRLSTGSWNSQQVVSQIGGNQSQPDTDGTIISYAAAASTSHIVWQPVAGGTEQVLNIPGSGILPSVSGGLISFAYDATNSGIGQIAVYDVASNVLYNVTADANPGDTNNKTLNDISVAPDGKVRVVWQELDANSGWNIYAYVFNLPSTTSSLSNLIGSLVQNGCIDNSGIGNALLSKLSAAQAAISSGNVQTAINILTALKSQIQAQAGKHISTSCTMNGTTFNPVTALLDDVQGLIDGLRVSLVPNPITGYVVDTNGAAVAGAAVVIADANGNTVATTTTDITGFYFFATTGVLSPGGSYTVGVSGHPATSQNFGWSGSEMTFNFAVN